MTTPVLDENLVVDQAVACGHEDRRRVLLDRGHRLRAERRCSSLKPAFARSACRSHGRRAIEATSPQVTSGDYDTGAQAHGGVVCLANGTRVPISQVKVGDQVLATDPSTGRTEARTVTATMGHDDDDLRDLTIVDPEGHHGTLQTTDHHKIWSVSAGAWVLASDLHDGDQLREPDSSTATLVETTKRPGHQQMLDLTVAVDHDFYVVAGDDSVLVHNCGPWTPSDLPFDADAQALANEIGGSSQIEYLGREIDAVSMTEVGQAKPATQVLGSTARNQMRFTFDTAKATNRTVVYAFKGGMPTDPAWLAKLAQYSSETGIPYRVITI